MKYSQLISKLFQVNLHGGMKLGLENMHRLLQHCHSPHEDFPSVHVAGTNGKGSVATKIASTLHLAGYKVGLYTSPHISCFRERIRVNGEMITENQVEKYLSYLFEIADRFQISPTFFEFATLMAFLHFAEQSVDCAVLEVGLGGRLDATNVITPLLSVITSISLDHTEILGRTIQEITLEKAGIIKPHIPVVIGPRVSLKVIEPIAIQRNSPLFQVKEENLLFDKENSAIARAALEKLKATFVLPLDVIEKGLLDRPPCRLQKILLPDRKIPLFLDVGHNPDGLIHLFRAIRDEFPSVPLSILFGLSKNKDISICLKIIASECHTFFPIEAANARGASTSLLQAGLLALKVDQASIHLSPTISRSLDLALIHAQQNHQVLVVCGTFFIMSAIRQALSMGDVYDETDLNER